MASSRSKRGQHRAILAHLGAMLAHLGVMWAELAAHVGPSGGYVGQPRPKMRLLQTLRMGHKPPPPQQQQQPTTTTNNQQPTTNNKRTNERTNKQTNNDNRPYKHPAIYGVFWLSHATLHYFKYICDPLPSIFLCNLF